MRASTAHVAFMASSLTAPLRNTLSPKRVTSRHFAVARQHSRREPRNQFRGFHADRIAADVNGGVAGHGSILPGGALQRSWAGLSTARIGCPTIYAGDAVMAYLTGIGRYRLAYRRSRPASARASSGGALKV